MKTFRVHIDTEFTDLTNSDLLSLGMVAEDGSEFYVENLDHIKAWVSPWVREHVFPLLGFAKFGKSRLAASVSAWEWISELDCDTVIISSDHHVDMKILSDLFNGDSHPKISKYENVIVNIYHDCDKIILDRNGTTQEYYELSEQVRQAFSTHVKNYLAKNNLIAHHALSDAKANRYAYDLIVKEFGIRT